MTKPTNVTTYDDRAEASRILASQTTPYEPPAAGDEQRREEESKKASKKAKRQSKRDAAAQFMDLEQKAGQQASEERKKLSKKADKSKRDKAAQMLDLEQEAGKQASAELTKIQRKAQDRRLAEIVKAGNLPRWRVYDPNQKSWTNLLAVSREQAEREARRMGLSPTRFEITGQVEWTEEKKQEILRRLGQPGKSAGAKADFERLIKLGVLDEDEKFDRESFDAREEAARALAGIRRNKKLERYRIPDSDEFDIINAIRGGITNKEFEKAGFDMDTIRETRKWVQKHDAVMKKLDPYLIAPGQYDVMAAMKHIPRDELRTAGFSTEQLQELDRIIDQKDSYYKTLMKYRDDDGYDIVKAYKDGVSRDFLERVGFDSEVVKTVADRIDAAQFLGESREDVVKRITSNNFGGHTTVPGGDDYVQLKGGGTCRRQKYESLPEHMQKELDKVGMDQFEEKYLATGETTKDTLKEAGISMIPIYGTYHIYKSGAPTWEVALSGALDLLWVAPPVRMLAGAARMGTKLGAKGAARAARAITVAELQAPITMLKHPGRTVKLALDPIESALRPGKIPLESTTITYHTAKVPSVSTKMPGLKGMGNLTKEQAMKARDELIRLSILKGKKPVTQVGNQEIKLQRSLLEKAGGVAVSSTPDVRPFMKGATVGGTKGGDLFVAPNMVERFTAATAMGEAPEGGVRGALLIRDPDILAKLQPSGKMYQGTAEVEMTLKAGEKLPPPSQILLTRDLQGEPLRLLVFGKPYSKAEIAGFKLFAPENTIKQIFAKRIEMRTVDDLVKTEKKLAEAQAEAKKLTGSAKTKALEKVDDLKAERAKLVAEVERRYAQALDYVAVDTTGGRSIAAARRVVETAADLQERARVARTDGKRADTASARRAVPEVDRAALRKATRVEPRIPEKVRQPRLPKDRAVMSPDIRATATPTRFVSPEQPRTTTKPLQPEEPRVPVLPGVPTFPQWFGEPPTRGAEPTDTKAKRAMEDTGKVQWKQGHWWIMVEPPAKEGEVSKNVQYSRRPFWGVRKVKGSPEETFAWRGNPPKQFMYEMGATAINIHTREKPHLRYRKTRAGKKRSKRRGMLGMF